MSFPPSCCLLIGGVDVSDMLQAKTLSIDGAIGQRSTCSFTLRDPAATYRPSKKQVVYAWDLTQLEVLELPLLQVGPGGSISVPTSTALDALPGLSVLMHLVPDAVDQVQQLFEVRTPGVYDVTGLSMWLNERGGVSVVVASSSLIGSNYPVYSTPDGILTAGQDVDIAVTVCNGQYVEVIVDGAVVLHAAITATLATLLGASVTFFGSGSWCSSVGYSGGATSLSLWNYAMDETQAGRYRQVKLFGNETGLLVGYDCMDSSGSVLEDLGPHGLTASMSSIGWSTATNTWRAHLAFGGSILKYPEKNTASGVRWFSVSCTDFMALADRRLVVEKYTGPIDASVVAVDIVSKYLAQYGVTANHVQSGISIKSISWSFVYPSGCFDDLCKNTGFSWYIDYYRDLHLFARETNTAPIAITDDVCPTLGDTLVYDRAMDQFYDAVTISGGNGVSAKSYSDTFTLDGSATSYNLTRKPGAGVSATLNGAVLQVGVKQVDSGKDLYWSEGDGTVELASAGTAGQVLVVSYRAQISILVSVEDDSAIDEMAGIEGDDGYYEKIVQDTSVTSFEQGLDYGDGELRQVAQELGTATFDTYTQGLRPGQIIPFYRTDYGVHTDLLIQKVTYKDAGLEQLVCSVTAVSGEKVNTWVDYFKKMTAAGRLYNIGSSTTLIKAKGISEEVLCADSATISLVPCSVVGIAKLGQAVVL